MIDQYQNRKHFFIYKNCGSKFCTNCPKNNIYIPDYSCPLCGERFSKGKGNLVIVEKILIILIVDNVVNIRIGNIFLNAKIVEVNIVHLVLGNEYIFQK